MSFIGSFEHKLDSKGRIVVPSCFREELGARVVITSVDKKCISVYSEKNWGPVADRLEENALKTLSGSDAKRLIMSLSFAIEIDSAGRILMPEKMRSGVGIVQDVFIIGNNKKIEIWDSSRWRKFIEESDGLISAINELLPGL
jgi:MraZ protein